MWHAFGTSDHCVTFSSIDVRSDSPPMFFFIFFPSYLSLDTSRRPLADNMRLNAGTWKQEVYTLHHPSWHRRFNLLLKHLTPHIKCSALIDNWSKRLPSNCMLTPCIMLTKWLRQNAHLKKTNCSQGLVLEQGAASHPAGHH